MTIQEFETMTKFHPSIKMFDVISEAYMSFDGDKQSFCKAYVQDKDGLASSIQRKATLEDGKSEDARRKELEAKDAEIAKLQSEMERLKKKVISDAILSQIGQHFQNEGNDLYDSIQMVNEQILEFCEEADGLEFKTAVESRKRMNDKLRECNLFVDVIAKARSAN